MFDFTVAPLTLDAMRQIYADRLPFDFPPAEVKALSVIERAFARGGYAGYAAASGGEILSYAFFALTEAAGRPFALFDYFAVHPNLRGRGVGGAFLRELIAGPLREMACVLLEVEDPDFASDAAQFEHRSRRLRFYVKNGLTDTGVRGTVFGVPYRVFALPLGEPLTVDEARRRYAALYRAMLGPEVYRREIAIR